MMNKFRHKKVTSMAAGLPVTSLGHLKGERGRLGGSDTQWSAFRTAWSSLVQLSSYVPRPTLWQRSHCQLGRGLSPLPARDRADKPVEWGYQWLHAAPQLLPTSVLPIPDHLALLPR